MDKIFIKKLGTYAVYLFAAIGFILLAGYMSVRFGLTNQKGIIDDQRSSFLNQNNTAADSSASSTGEWSQGPEWQILKSAIVHDTAPIYKAAGQSNVDPRLLTAILIPEQLRLFHSNRELFKQVFAPLQILGSQSQFSWGIMGIKETTAELVESNLKNSSSPYYLGAEYEHLLDFKTENKGQERFARITDEKDHYYGYLYAALYLKQIMRQWNNAGFDISSRPEILATLYNIGFEHSHPNAQPQAGGAEIDIGNTSYSFGELAAEFFYSNELRDIFP